jgi:hypothetical protein
MPSCLLYAAALAAALATALCAPASAEILVNVDKETQRMTVTVDRVLLYTWPVSTGLPGRTETPNGTFRTNRMDANHLSQEFNRAPMPYTVFFDLHGHAVHGFLNADRIGNPASHGCVRLPADKAALLFDLIKMEGLNATSVVITGRTPSLQSLLLSRRRALRDAGTAPSMLFIAHIDDKPAPHGVEAASEMDRLQEAEPLQPLTSEDYDRLVPLPPDSESSAASS